MESLNGASPPACTEATAVKPLSAQLSSLQRSGIREVMDLAFQGIDVLRLEVGDPDFPTPAHIVEAAAAAAAAGFTHYTPSRGLGEVREAMASKVRSFNGIQADAGDVLVSAGGGHGLYAVYAALSDPGDRILVPDPGWPNYRTIASLCGVETVPYPLQRENRFLPDLDLLEHLAATTPKLKAIIVTSPSNPTGAVWPREVFERILEICSRHDLFLISDECYEAIVFEGKHISPATLDDDGRTISVFTVSKTYAMTGWRVGYLVGPREVVDMAAKVVESSVSCAAAVSQKAAQAALTGDQTCVSDMVAAYRSRRDLAVRLLGSHSIPTSKPAGAFYIMASVPTADTLDFAKRLVKQAGVAVAPGETFGKQGGGMIRLSLASKPETIEAGIARLAAFCLGEMKPGATMPAGVATAGDESPVMTEREMR